jgi:Ca2+-binding RTX toxin-like protein
LCCQELSITSLNATKVVVQIQSLALSTGVALAAVELTSGPDTYNGNDQANTVFGRGGDDRIRGNGGDDDLYGGSGRDKLFGLGGDDLLVGGPGEDQLNGAAGNDVIVAGDDGVSDEVSCGRGEDVAYLSGPDHSSLSEQGCEELETFKSMDEVSNPDGQAGS